MNKFKQEILQKLELVTIEVRDRLDQEVKYRKRDITDSRMTVNQLKQAVKGVQGSIKEAIVDNSDIRRTMAVLMRDVQMQQAMEAIDEVDRRSIALYGVDKKTPGAKAPGKS